MHTTVLDNDVRIHYDGGDLGGRVIIRYPDGREIATSWDQIAGTGKLVEVAIHSKRCFLQSPDAAYSNEMVAEIDAALAPYEEKK